MQGEMNMEHEFVDVSGDTVVALQERPNNMVALVGVKQASNRKAQLSAPVKGVDGAARVFYDYRVGVCRTDRGIEATRTLLVALHNQQVATVHVLHGYMVADIVL